MSRKIATVLVLIVSCFAIAFCGWAETVIPHTDPLVNFFVVFLGVSYAVVGVFAAQALAAK